MEAMRSTEAGVYEYELDAAARYVFLVNGAKLEAYRSITAAGTENINNMHYYRNTRRLEDGDLVLMDYAPDYRYYVSDIGRVWPVNGTYAPWQRELLQFTLDYHKAVMSRVKPGATPQQILADARAAMEPIVAKTKWSKPAYEAAARRLIETSGGALSHMVGMAVHDVGSYRDGLKPGHVFSIDPQLRVPEENLYLRFEDTIVVTETGFENFTALHPDGARCDGSAGEGEGPRAEGAGRPGRRGPAPQVAPQKTRTRPAVNSACHTTLTLRPTRQPPEHARGRVDVHERRVHPAVEPQIQVPLDRHLDAPAAAEREPDLVVAVRAIVREPQEPGDERPRPARPEVLAAAGQHSDSRPPGFARRTERPAGDVEVRLLMREQRLEPEAVRHLDADGAAEDRCPVGDPGDGWSPARTGRRRSRSRRRGRLRRSAPMRARRRARPAGR